MGQKLGKGKNGGEIGKISVSEGSRSSAALSPSPGYRSPISVFPISPRFLPFSPAAAKLACKQTLFYFYFLSFQKHWRPREGSERGARERNPLALAVNKSPVVYSLSPALDGLWRAENRGSVNKLLLVSGYEAYRTRVKGIWRCVENVSINCPCFTQNGYVCTSST